MSIHCYIGATSPDKPHLVHARFVHFDGHPAVVPATLAAIWAGHADHDTAALITAILANDWEYLDPDITTATLSPFAGQRPVPGVGMTLASEVQPPEPVTVFPLCHARHLDTEWVYLIDAGTDTIAVHDSDGTRVITRQLVGRPHSSGTDPGEWPCQPRPAAGAAR